ncbi:MAG TPA: hypothetical protein VKZ53_14840 [Candidatus Angelobacter sp.]|nr:hypothetical protein [Candidatus Angelobacter sp.]
MQGDEIGWDPISVCSHPSWESGIFVLYLFVVVVISLVKTMGVVRILWFLRRASRKFSHADAEWMFAWERCSNKILSLKRLTFFTLLWTVLVPARLLTRALVILSEQKVFSLFALSGSLVLALTLFEFGVLASALVYGVYALCEGALAWRKQFWGYARSAENPEPAA